MSVTFTHLRNNNRARFLGLVEKARLLAGRQAHQRRDESEARKRKTDRELQALRLREEWARADERHFQEEAESNRSWTLALLAMVTMFQSHPHHAPA